MTPLNVPTISTDPLASPLFLLTMFLSDPLPRTTVDETKLLVPTLYVWKPDAAFESTRMLVPSLIMSENIR